MCHEEIAYIIKQAEAKARELYENCTLKDGYVTDLHAMLGGVGYTSFITDFNNFLKNNETLLAIIKEDGIEAFTLLKSKEIYIDNKLIDEKKRFIVAHELGHIVLEHFKLDKGTVFTNKCSLQSKDLQDVAANYFAAELLMPTTLVKRIYNYTRSIYDLAAIFGVQINVMRFKLRRLEEGGLI